MLRAQSGDRDALGRLLDDVGPALHRYLRGIVKRDDVADDLLQDTYIVICKKLRWLREPKAFRSWSYRTANRIALRHLKKEGRFKLGRDVEPDDLLGGNLEAEFLASVQKEALSSMLAELPHASKTALWLHYIDDLTIAETASILEISPGTVKSRIAYGLQKLRASVAVNG